MIGCHKIHNGIIIDKIYEEGHYYTVTTFHRIGKVSVPIISTKYDDADYFLLAKGHKENNEFIEKFHVSQYCYNRHNVGDKYNDKMEPETADY